MKRIITFTKESRKKIKNQNNKVEIGKHNIELNDEIENNKTFTKWQRRKIRNPKNDEWIEENNIW